MKVGKFTSAGSVFRYIVCDSNRINFTQSSNVDLTQLSRSAGCEFHFWASERAE